MIPPAQFLRRSAAAQYLRAKFGIGSSASLAKYACLGGGPRFHLCGRIPLYEPDDLDAWALSRIGEAMASTSDNPDHVKPRGGPGRGRRKPPGEHVAAD